MFTRDEDFTLSNIGDGAAEEIFQAAWQKLMDNVIDPNTKAQAVRKITLVVSVKPNEERTFGEVAVNAKVALQECLPYKTSCMIGKVGSKGLFREIIAKQNSLFTGTDGEKVVGIDSKKGDR